MIMFHMHLCDKKIDKPFSLREEQKGNDGIKYHVLSIEDHLFNDASIFATREQLNQLNGELEKVLYDETYQQLEDRLINENNKLEDRVLELESEISRLRGED